ncbi:MAG: hypothetical protein JWP35_3828 [Caulobacter sp.]|nr:hypothetical protein [Caulobacter sp.]
MKILVVASAVLSLGLSGVAQAAANSAPRPQPPAPPVMTVAPEPKAAPLPPPSPEALALGRRVMDAYGGVEGFSGIIDGLVDGALAGLKPDPQVMQMFGPMKTRFMTVLHAHMPELVEATAVSWAQTYSVEEMTTQLAYMESPAARSIARKSPKLVAQLGLELGWFVRQVMLTDPKMSKYLAAAGKADEPPLTWPAPSPESMDALMKLMASTKLGPYLKNPDKIWGDAKRVSKKQSASSAAMEKRMKVILPILINDVLAIIANNLTAEEIQAQADFTQSPAGKLMQARSDKLGVAVEQNFKPIMKKIMDEVMGTSKSV